MQYPQVELLSCGGVKALVQCVMDSNNSAIARTAACSALATLMVDGAIAVEVRLHMHPHTQSLTFLLFSLYTRVRVCSILSYMLCSSRGWASFAVRLFLMLL